MPPITFNMSSSLQIGNDVSEMSTIVLVADTVHRLYSEDDVEVYCTWTMYECFK